MGRKGKYGTVARMKKEKNTRQGTIAVTNSSERQLLETTTTKKEGVGKKKRRVNRGEGNRS